MYISDIKTGDFHYTASVVPNGVKAFEIAYEFEVTDEDTGEVRWCGIHEVRQLRPLGYIKAIKFEYTGVVTEADLELLDIIEDSEFHDSNYGGIHPVGYGSYFLAVNGARNMTGGHTIKDFLDRMIELDNGFQLFGVVYKCDMKKLKRFYIKQQLATHSNK